MLYYSDNNYFFITCRTNLQKKYFIDNNKKEIVLDQLFRVERECEIKFDAFSILSNHYHLLFYLENGNDLKKIMQMINGGVSYKLNKVDKINRVIWQDYYNRNVYSKKAYFNIMGYIVANPFKHRLVKSIDDLASYPFCNYKEKIEEFGKHGINEIIYNIKNLNWE